MSRPQQQELNRSGRTPVDPDAVPKRPRAERRKKMDASESMGPVPEENQPGHHPDEEQDKPKAPPPK